jgi:hypothetical protein
MDTPLLLLSRYLSSEGEYTNRKANAPNNKNPYSPVMAFGNKLKYFNHSLNEVVGQQSQAIVGS